MESVWDKTIKIIQEKVSKQNFDTWIKPVKILALEDQCISLSVPNKFFRDWLIENYIPMIKNSLRQVIGMDVDVDFVLSKDREKVSTSKKEAVMDRKKDVLEPQTTKNRNFSFLNANYTFDRFVVGPSNEFAHAASVAVSKQPAKTYNPLFIYGGSGLGKTHLLNAIGLMTASNHPD